MIEGGVAGRLDCGLGPAILDFATLATGHDCSVHGVTGPFEVRPDGGGVQPTGARAWRVDPVWQTLSTAGHATAVIAWPGTAPGDDWLGLVVDDRFPHPMGDAEEEWPLPPGVAPARLRTALRPLRLHPGELDDTVSGGLPTQGLAALLSTHAVATHVAEHEPWSFLAVHYRLPDRSEAALTLFDAMLAALMQHAGAAADVLLVSTEGVLVAQGPGFPCDTLLHGVSLLDVAPTILARFGLCAAMPGRILDGTRHGELDRVRIGVRPGSKQGHVPPPPPEAVPHLAAVEHTALLQQARAALAAGDHGAAAPLLEQALLLRPGDLEIRLLLGQSRFFLDDWQACLAHGRVLAAVATDAPWGEMMLGAALALGGRADEAVPHLQAASRLAGHDASAHLRLGAIALRLGRPIDAERHYAVALAAGPDAFDARAGLGLARLAQQDAEAAERHLRAALGLRFHAPALHHQLALLYTAQSRWPEAAASLRTALAQSPGLAGATELLATVARHEEHCPIDTLHRSDQDARHNKAQSGFSS